MVTIVVPIMMVVVMVMVIVIEIMSIVLCFMMCITCCFTSRCFGLEKGIYLDLSKALLTHQNQIHIHHTIMLIATTKCCEIPQKKFFILIN